MGLTAPAWGDSDPQPAGAPPPTPATESGTPLVLRAASKPLELAQEPQHAGLGWKVVAVLVVLGGGVLLARKRGLPGKRGDTAQLSIVRRTSIGMRSELLVVNVEGQRLLLGVTPHSIQSLAVLDGEEQEAALPEPEPAQTSTLGARFAAMLDSADARAPRKLTRDRSPASASASAPAPAPASAPAPALFTTVAAAQDDDDIAGQARGLLALRRGG
jgi:flagellar protein FliO/FliZ